MVAAGRRHRARRHRGHPGVADHARRQGAGADLRPVRPSARRDRRALRRQRSPPSSANGARCSRRTRSRPRSGSTSRACSRWCTATPPPRWRSRSPRSAQCAGSATSSSTATPPRRSAACRFEVDAWQIDARQRRPAEVPVRPARLGADHVQRALAPRSPSTASISRPASSRRASWTATGRVIQSNYFDLAMLMDYWSERRLNHHTEATSMLYAAREALRIVLEEGLDARLCAPRARQRGDHRRVPRHGAGAVRRPGATRCRTSPASIIPKGDRWRRRARA